MSNSDDGSEQSDGCSHLLAGEEASRSTSDRLVPVLYLRRRNLPRVMIHATAVNFTTVIVNEPLKLKKQMQPQSAKNYRSYMRSHHLGLCNRVDLGYVCGPPWSQTEADSDQTLEADAGHRRSLAIKSSQAVSNRTLAQVELLLEL